MKCDFGNKKKKTKEYHTIKDMVSEKKKLKSPRKKNNNERDGKKMS